MNQVDLVLTMTCIEPQLMYKSLILVTYTADFIISKTYNGYFSQERYT